jgi:heme A synthase
VIFSYLVYRKFNYTVKIYSLILILIIIVGGIGGAVVLSELNPAIRTVHLAGAQTIAALMVASFISVNIKKVETSNKIRTLSLITAFLAIASLLSGAYAVWQGAGAVCYKWPLCDDYFIPRYTNQWIHMAHRIISIGLLLHILRLSLVLIKNRLNQILIKLGYLLLIVGILQTLIGASIPLSEFSVWSRSIHLGLATIVWMVSVSIIMVLKTKKN